MPNEHTRHIPALYLIGGTVPVIGLLLYLIVALVRWRKADPTRRTLYVMGAIPLLALNGAGLLAVLLNQWGGQFGLGFEIGPVGFAVLSLWIGYTGIRWLVAGDTYSIPYVGRNFGFEKSQPE